MTRPLASTRHAITLVEVLLAILLLALTVGVVCGAVSAIARMEAEGRRRVAAYEVANRLLLQHLDDDAAMPPAGLPIEYGEHRFFWELDRTGARMVVNHRQEAASNLQALDRFELVGVTVFDANSSGTLDTRGEPLAFLSRVIDPFAPRNPDSLEVFTQNPGALVQRLDRLFHPTVLGGGNVALNGRRLK